MKKILCTAFLMLFVSFPVMTYATSVNEPLPSFNLFSSYSVDELLRSKDFILDQLADRGYSEITLPSGKYIVGEDIPSGKYTLKLDGVTGGHSASVIIDTADGQRVNLISVMYNLYSYVTHSARDGWQLATVELSDGQVLTIVIADSYPLTFYTYDGI